MSQPYKFRLVMKDGTVMEGSADSRDLAIDHVRHCLRMPELQRNPVVKGYYLGKYAKNENPVEVKP